MNFITYRDLIADVNSWVNARPDWYECRGVVGIPSSGMIPACVVASRCGLPVTDLETFLNTGGRFSPTRHPGRAIESYPAGGSRVLVLDDSVYEGTTLRWTERELKSHSGLAGVEYEFAAVYSSHSSVPYAYFREVSSPRMFEWNWLRSTTLRECVVDLDGFICEDPPEGISEAEYEAWLPRAKPLYLPQSMLGVIASARLEKYRGPTVEWLKRHGVYHHVLYLIDATAQEREAGNLYVEHKVRHYKNSQACLFVESNHDQAAELHRRTEKPVLCVSDFTLFQKEPS